MRCLSITIRRRMTTGILNERACGTLITLPASCHFSVGQSAPAILVSYTTTEAPSHLAFDPLHVDDRRKNAHSLILGPTGSGKTSLLISQLLHMMAMRKPRLYLITALPTFGLLADYCEANGLNVVRRAIDAEGTVTLPPFADASKLTQDPQPPHPTEEQDEPSRDLLGEMEIQARLMITGGAANEEQRLMRDDLDLLRNAIIDAGRSTRPGDQTMTSDVVTALKSFATSDSERDAPPRRREAAARMADAMHLFCTGKSGHVFDRPGKAWPDADITVVELGHYARKGYEDRLGGSHNRANDSDPEPRRSGTVFRTSDCSGNRRSTCAAAKSP